MKTILVLLAAMLGLAVAESRLAAADAGQVTVAFDHPENFTDIKDRPDPTDAGRDAILETLRECITGEAVKHLPAGATLAITFTDIDLAGDFEPWRGPQYDNIRIVKPIYPPAFKFTYRIADSAGKVWKEGLESIRDLNFETRAALDPSDSLRIEKDILVEWVRNNLKGIK